jgi:ABC-type Fe3+/spermidine/putrescine transport system ATPase subunit
VSADELVRLSEVRFTGVGKRYGAAWVVKDVSFYVQPGHFYTLLGPSGCGKSTLLRMLAGFTRPDAGRITIDDEPIDHLPPRGRNLGVVPQGLGLWPHMSVFEHAAFGLRERRAPEGEVLARSTAALAQMGLEGLASRRPGDLSPAQQRRLALARALAVRPKLLLLDEPLSSLDAQVRTELRLDLARLHRDIGITTLYATHDPAEALALSTRVAVLGGGRLVQEGKPEDVYWRPRDRFVAALAGGASLLAVTVVEIRETGVVVETRGGARLPVATGEREWRVGQPGLLCLRPEALRVEEAELAEGGLRGRVTGHVFEGGRQSYDVEVPGGTVRVETMTSAVLGRAFRAGDTVRVQIAPETATLLPDEPAGGGGQ